MLTYGQKMELEITERVTTQVYRDCLLRQLARRFGSLPAAVVEQVQQADRGTIERWADRIFDAPSLDDMLAA